MTGDAVFKLIKCANPKLSRTHPPLKTAETLLLLNPLERAEYLQDILMASFDVEHDSIA